MLPLVVLETLPNSTSFLLSNSASTTSNGGRLYSPRLFFWKNKQNKSMADPKDIKKTLVEMQIEAGDMVRLHGEGEYGKYFSHMAQVFRCLLSWYSQIKSGNQEQVVVRGYVEKLLNTINALAMKFTYHPEHTLALDLNDSGYPHYMGIMELENDINNREAKLKSILPRLLLKDRMIDHLLRSTEEPSELLLQLASRSYYESLNIYSLITMVTFGDIVLVEESVKTRRYLFSWLCYDSVSNVPHVHIMLFDQDKVCEPLTENNPDRLEFLRVIKANGGRVPSTFILAKGIDDELEHIHPKFLKRIKLGPILTQEYSHETEVEHPLLIPLRKFGKENDFILLVRSEVTVSKGPTDIKGKGFLQALGPARIREIFAINNDDVDCSEAGASEVKRQILMPHHVLQHIDFSDPSLTKYIGAGKITYNKQEVYIIE